MTERIHEGTGLPIVPMDEEARHRSMAGALDADEGLYEVKDREAYGTGIADLPLYEIVQEIERKWDPHKHHMVIDAVLLAEDEYEAEGLSRISDNQLLTDNIPEGQNGGIGWYCEFGGTEGNPEQVRFFNTIAAAKNWFLNEVKPYNT